VNRLLADNDNALEILNWNPEISLFEGIKKSIAWFKKPENLNYYKNDRYTI
jgi:dTDP-glucose 4,6-dehydratase